MFTHPSPSSGDSHHRDQWSVPMMLGELAAGQRYLINTVDIIHDRLADGDRRMAEHGERHARHDERITALEKGATDDNVSRTEKIVARWLTFIVPLVVLIATRSWETAIKVLALLR